MTDETDIPSDGEAVSYPIDSNEPISLEDAARELSEAREKALNPPAESAKHATAEEESPVEGDAAADDQPTGETEEADPVEEPPLDLPRSWTKEQADHWKALPRSTQEYLAEQDSKASAEVRRVQNEAAEARKAAQAEREAAEKARQQYEAQIPSLMKELENVTQANFSDIKTMDDVVKLQSEDPFRFQAWQVHQMRLQAAKAEADRVQRDAEQAKQGKRAAYEAEQNKLLVELVPEMADTKKASELRERAVKMLTDDLGLKTDQLSRWMQDDTGHEILSNAGIQRLIADGVKFRDIKSAPKAVAAKPIPPVQRPGTAKPANSGTAATIQTLEKQLAQATGDRAVEISTQIYQLERKAASR